MNNPINRTTVQVEDNKYKVYPKGAPLFYKKQDGSYGDIDHTFNDTTSSIGDISLMDKGVVSVGKRKGNNPHKVVGIRPDSNQHLGTQQLEFSLINVELDGESQDFNVEDDLEIKLRASTVFQLVKINKDFEDFKIEFDIYAKGLELQNDKYSEITTIRDYEFNIKNLGEIEAGNTDISLDNLFIEDKNIPYIDSCVFKITNDYITTGQYSKIEEFGDSDLSNYIFDNNVYNNGSGMYYKDCLIFIAKVNNIENYEDVIANDIAYLYGCTLLKNDESHSEEEYMDGYYFIKDGKKIGGYFSKDNIFLAFFNTKDIPNDIKTLFIRKSFENTSYMDISLNDFYTTINDRFNKDLKIEVNDDYYEPINDRFNFKVNKESFYIGLPIVFDNDYNALNLKTTHTLKNNADGSYRYTKYFNTDGLLNNNNNIKYIDTALYVSDSDDNNMWRASTFNAGSNQKTTSNLTSWRDSSITSFATVTSASDILYPRCGDFGNKTVGSKSTTYHWSYYQTHYIFDSSGITSTVSALSFKIRGGHNCSSTGTAHTDISLILLKSNTEGGNNVSNWNDFVGHTSGWDADDVTEYCSEFVVTDAYGSPAIQTMTLNSEAETDIEDDDAFKLAVIDYDQWYLNSLDTSYGVSSAGRRQLWANQIDATTTAYRPYLDVTVEGAEAVTYNAAFFGTNF